MHSAAVCARVCLGHTIPSKLYKCGIEVDVAWAARTVAREQLAGGAYCVVRAQQARRYITRPPTSRIPYHSGLLA